MKRLTSDNAFEMNMTELALNQVFVQDGWAWYRKGPEDECSVCDLIRGAAAKGLDLENIELDPNLTDEELGDVMLDWLQFGEQEPEGVLAILYRALWAMAELRERLKQYEDTMPLERAQELAQAQKDRRLVALPCKVGESVHGENWIGEVVELSINSEGIFLYVRSGGGGFYCSSADLRSLRKPREDCK